MLNRDVERYVQLRRTLGFKFRTPAILLRSFTAFAETHGDEAVRSCRVVDWAACAPSQHQRRNRLLTVRRFALAMQAEDPRHEVPAADALGRGRYQRRRPHIYADEDIARLMSAASRLKPAGSFRPLMYTTLIGLLAATGMRISEALSMRVKDVTDDGLLILQTKFRKSRMLPIRAACSQYMTAPGRPWSPICRFASDAVMPPVLCSRPKTAAHCPTARSTVSSYCWRESVGCVEVPACPVPGCTICATRSPYAAWRNPRPTATGSRAKSWPCQHIWAIRMPLTPTGICRQHRS